MAYVYAPDRKAERPIAHLADFKGVLQVDGYGGYRVLAERGDVRLVFTAVRFKKNGCDRWYRLVLDVSRP